MEMREAPASDVEAAERLMLTAFRKDLDELLAGRSDPRPRADDDKAIFALADQAVKQYHAATARSTELPRLSAVQYWEIRQRLYVTHSALGPLGELLALDGVEDIHINGTRAAYLEYGDRREALSLAEEGGFDLMLLGTTGPFSSRSRRPASSESTTMWEHMIRLVAAVKRLTMERSCAEGRCDDG